jgi:hypothetical protein
MIRLPAYRHSIADTLSIETNLICGVKVDPAIEQKPAPRNRIHGFLTSPSVVDGLMLALRFGIGSLVSGIWRGFESLCRVCFCLSYCGEAN